MEEMAESVCVPRLKKLALFLLLEDLLDEEEATSPIYLISLAVSQWPNRYTDLPCLHVDSLLRGGLNYFAIHADSQSFEKVTRLDLPTFDCLYQQFEPLWLTRKIAQPLLKAKQVRLISRSFSGRSCLVLVLLWMSHSIDLTGLALSSGTTLTTISDYVRWGVFVLKEVMGGMPSAALEASPEHLKDLGQQAGETYGPTMLGCCIITDGSIHPLEHDEDAQWNYQDFDHEHPDYNGWKSCYCKKALYFFALDGCVVWYCYDCHGRWHDGQIFDRSSEFVRALPEGCWILGDSAFPRIKGKVGRARKRNELLSENRDEATWQLNLEAFCSKMRMSSEWGIKDLKNSWRRMKLPLPSDDHTFRRGYWQLSMHLHNFRCREMSSGQMKTVFIQDKFYSSC
jgi:DDE superfamily endonuclease